MAWHDRSSPALSPFFSSFFSFIPFVSFSLFRALTQTQLDKTWLWILRGRSWSEVGQSRFSPQSTQSISRPFLSLNPSASAAQRRVRWWHGMAWNGMQDMPVHAFPESLPSSPFLACFRLLAFACTGFLPAS
ncbi:hypothetical protein Mapa_007716 [Marchantia paleacea]|nr:hypothetical protein Mapa_007716 [Marchantia paleacea]